jgi:hypothetical protein
MRAVATFFFILPKEAQGSREAAFSMKKPARELAYE